MRHVKLISLVVAAIMVATIAPAFFGTEDTSAASFQVDKKDLVLYLSGGASSGTFTLTGSNVANATWTFEDADDGLGVASFNTGSSTATGSSVTVNALQQGTIYVWASLSSTDKEKLYVVVLPQPGVSNGEFLFFVKIINRNHDGDYNGTTSDLTMLTTSGKWVRGYGANALVALNHACSIMNWDLDCGTGGWFNTFMGLSTYSESGGFTYWIQYHWENNASGGGWYFNTTTLGYIQGSSTVQYIGLIFDLSLSPTNGVNYGETMPPTNVGGASAP